MNLVVMSFAATLFMTALKNVAVRPAAIIIYIPLRFKACAKVAFEKTVVATGVAFVHPVLHVGVDVFFGGNGF